MSDENAITPAQCLGARAMLGMSRAQLAEASKVSQATLADFEAGKRQPYTRTLADIREALEAQGVEFIGAGGYQGSGGPGVRLKDAP